MGGLKTPLVENSPIVEYSGNLFRFFKGIDFNQPEGDAVIFAIVIDLSDAIGDVGALYGVVYC